MGELIRKGASADDILIDVRTTFTNATARGGDWQTSVLARLGPIVTLADGVETRKREATAAVGPAAASLAALNIVGDRLLGRISDDIWNLVGRPGQDPVLDILFPGGIAYYTEGDVEEQPDRMDLLAELLESGIHPQLEHDRAVAFAAEIRASGDAIRAAVEVYRPLRARLELANRMHVAIAKAGHVVLARLKRQWKADGKSEAEIHSVIPDRPTTEKKPKTES